MKIVADVAGVFPESAQDERDDRPEEAGDDEIDDHRHAEHQPQQRVPVEDGGDDRDERARDRPVRGPRDHLVADHAGAGRERHLTQRDATVTAIDCVPALPPIPATTGM